MGFVKSLKLFPASFSVGYSFFPELKQEQSKRIQRAKEDTSNNTHLFPQPRALRNQEDFKIFCQQFLSQIPLYCSKAGVIEKEDIDEDIIVSIVKHVLRTLVCVSVKLTEHRISNCISPDDVVCALERSFE